MIRPLTFAVLFSVLLTLSNCGNDDGISPPSADEDEVVQAAKFEEIDSPSAFQEALKETGDAKGSVYSGDYDVPLSGLSYSNDCTATHIMERDFFVYPDATEDEAWDLIHNGYRPVTFFLKVRQWFGRITFADAAPGGVDMTGAVNEDGRFRIVHGTYEKEGECRWSVYEGRMAGNDRIEGVFKSFIHDSGGSCSVMATFSGKRF